MTTMRSPVPVASMLFALAALPAAAERDEQRAIHPACRPFADSAKGKVARRAGGVMGHRVAVGEVTRLNERVAAWAG